jgi:hypothetical protein
MHPNPNIDSLLPETLSSLYCKYLSFGFQKTMSKYRLFLNVYKLPVARAREPKEPQKLQERSTGFEKFKHLCAASSIFFIIHVS